MSYRPSLKKKDEETEQITVTDLPLDAETLQGYKPCVNIVTLEDNGSTTAGTWLAKTNKVSALVDGQLFLYKITVAGASTTTLNITGSGGALGAKTVYRTGTTKLTTHYAVGHYILLAYNSLNTCFRVVNDYDSNSDTYVRQYQHGKNAAGATNLYPILTRYNLTNKSGTYDNAYARFYTDTYINVINGYLYAPKVYSGGSEVAVKTDIPTKLSELTNDTNFVADASYVHTDNNFTTTYKNAVDANTAKVSNVQSDWNATTGLARILNKPDILPITNYTGDSPVELYNLAKGRYINATANDIALYNYAGGAVLPSVRWHPGEILTVLDNLHNWVLETLYASEYYIFSGKANSRFDQSEYREFSAADVPAASSSGLGSVGKPLYIDVITSEQGMKQLVFKECNQFAGATKLILNGTDLSSLATFLYAPTTSGTSGQFLKSAGANASPTWETVTIPTKSSWNYDDMYVKYSAAQTLTETQQAQARANIGASRNPHEHPTYLETTTDTPSINMVPDASYKLTTGGGSNVIFKTPSDAYKIAETLRKGSEETTAVGYYKIATINHVNWNFCDFCMLVKNSYSGTAYSTVFNCSCSDSNVKLQSFKLDIISGTDISNKLAYLYTYNSDNNLIKIEVFIHATRFEHPMCYIINARPGQQLVIPTQ
jgi:hypothetical protein